MPPEYPPPRTWSFPPPPIGRRFLWLAAVGSVLAGTALVAGVVATFVVGSRDAPGMIDDQRVLERIDDACDRMTSTVESLPPGRTPRDRAAVIGDQNLAIEQMLIEVESLDAETRASDRPLEAWLDDWRALVEARTDYAEVIARGGSGGDVEIVVPFDEDGDPITFRMEDALLDDVCVVPPVLLDPAAGSDLST